MRNFDWKAAAVTVIIAFVGIKLLEKFVIPMLPASVRRFVD